MDAEELWTRWTVRVAMALYVLSLAVRGLCRGRRSCLAWSRLAWTVGCLAYLAHVGWAFAYYHHWSHAHAYETTARQTLAVTGFDWGGGLYANYIFTVVWIADAGWWWTNLERTGPRARSIDWLVHGFMGFMAFNATVVFAGGPVRWFGIFACVLLSVAAGYAFFASRWR